MDNIIYTIIGKLIVWGTSGYVIGKTAAWALEKLTNFLGHRIKIMWVVVEYFIYRNDFKQWVKNKQRHHKLKDL